MKVNELLEDTKGRDPQQDRLEDENIILQSQFKKLKSYDQEMYKKLSAEWEKWSHAFSIANIDNDLSGMKTALDKLEDIAENWSNRNG
jgi:hypothetical protein